MGVMITRNAVRFDPYHPDPALVDIYDIAEGLAKACRFAGQCIDFYCVAHHSLIVCLNAPERLKVPAILHDGHEGLLGDVISPIKEDARKALEDTVQAAIHERYSITLTPDDEALIKELDLRALATERRDLIPKHRWADFDWECIDGVEPFKGRLQPQGPIHHWAAWRDAYLEKFTELTMPHIHRVH